MSRWVHICYQLFNDKHSLCEIPVHVIVIGLCVLTVRTVEQMFARLESSEMCRYRTWTFGKNISIIQQMFFGGN